VRGLNETYRHVFDVLKLRRFLSPVPIQVTAILAQVAILAPQLSSFMPRSRVVPVVQIAPQFAAITRNLCLIMTDVAPEVAPIPPPIVSKHRSRTQSNQQ
jgi:hypothetical protein